MTNLESYFISCWNRKEYISKKNLRGTIATSGPFLKTLKHYLLFWTFIMLCLNSSADGGEICRSQFPCSEAQILHLTMWDSVRCWAPSSHSSKYNPSLCTRDLEPLRTGKYVLQWFFLESTTGGFACLMITTSISGPCSAKHLSTSKWAMEKTTYCLQFCVLWNCQENLFLSFIVFSISYMKSMK